ncbi:MAG: FUSC family protein [Deltaproteobacteria bacterium]|nr:FUSC family protein [Deltaproteobacteria bacterium]
MSPNAKEGIKVGLAIVITYGLALRFEWMSSTWAAIAVAFIAQPGEGQSLYKGVMRGLGTFVAFFTSLFLLALFPQDRWMLLIATSPFMGYFGYKMRGENEYLWFVA